MNLIEELGFAWGNLDQDRSNDSIHIESKEVVGGKGPAMNLIEKLAALGSQSKTTYICVQEG